MSSRIWGNAEPVLVEEGQIPSSVRARVQSDVTKKVEAPVRGVEEAQVVSKEREGVFERQDVDRDFPHPGKTIEERRPRGVCVGRFQVDMVAKRVFDVVFALVLLVIFAPLMVALCMAIWISSPGPAVFIQQRVGRRGQLFPCLKFRTMVVDAAEQLDRLLATDPVARREWERDQKLRNDVRVTSLGRFLRKSSLDELPQLFNILIGQMSVVGPRPIVINEICRYGTYLDEYCSVRPGLTGLWQVGGRNDVDYSARVAFDVEYARTWCFLQDLLICWRTVPALFLAKGCY